MNKDKKNIITGLFLAIALIGIASVTQFLNSTNTLNPFSRASFQTPNVTLTPETVLADLNDTFTTNIYVDTGGRALNSAQFVLQYDPSYLRIDQISVQNLLGRVLKNNIDAQNGLVNLSLAAECSDAGCNTLNGSGFVATLLVTTLSQEGSTTISLAPYLNNYMGTVLAFTNESGPVETTLTNTIINIGPTPAPTVVPSPTPSTSKAIIKGRVYDAISAESLSGVNIQVREPGSKGKSGLIGEYTTDSQGEYFVELDEGRYEFAYNIRTHIEEVNTLAVKTGDVINIDVALESSSNPGKGNNK